MDKLDILKLKSEVANLERVAERLDGGSIKESLLKRAEGLKRQITKAENDQVRKD